MFVYNAKNLRSRYPGGVLKGEWPSFVLKLSLYLWTQIFNFIWMQYTHSTRQWMCISIPCLKGDFNGSLSYSPGINYTCRYMWSWWPIIKGSFILYWTGEFIRRHGLTICYVYLYFYQTSCFERLLNHFYTSMTFIVDKLCLKARWHSWMLLHELLQPFQSHGNRPIRECYFMNCCTPFQSQDNRPICECYFINCCIPFQSQDNSPIRECYFMNCYELYNPRQ